MPNSLHRAVVCGLGATLLVAVAGCSVPEDSTEPPVTVQVPENTWRQVDRAIAAASVTARGEAHQYARQAMEAWLRRVRELTEERFIPWYAGYWTQQWLAMKVAWYEMNDEDGADPADERLAAYLREQYHARVLGPVAEEIDPDEVMERTTALYVTALGEGLEPIPRRYGVPQEPFDGRLQAIAAIAVASVPPQSASLHAVVRAEPLDGLPAYRALVARIRSAGGGAGDGPSQERMCAVSERAAEKFVEKIAVRGGASAAAAALGGVVGVAIGVAATVVGAMAHEKDKPALEAQLRENLEAALDEMWQGLMEDTATGVMAPVYHICGQIERSLASLRVEPVRLQGDALEADPFGGDLFEGDRYQGRPFEGDGPGRGWLETDQPFEAIF